MQILRGIGCTQRVCGVQRIRARVFACVCVCLCKCSSAHASGCISDITPAIFVPHAVQVSKFLIEEQSILPHEGDHVLAGATSLT